MTLKYRPGEAVSVMRATFPMMRGFIWGIHNHGPFSARPEGLVLPCMILIDKCIEGALHSTRRAYACSLRHGRIFPGAREANLI
jgi:hypothetical protein